MAEQLSPLDATFLELEEANWGAHMHIGAVLVFEPRPDGRAPSDADVSQQLEERIDELPRFRQRLSSPTTGGLSWPAWQTKDRFRASSHVRRAGLPEPGSERELLDWAGEFFSERLDRTRPLWELVVIEGLSEGRWALATKTHHCLVDGVGSVDTAHLFLDTEPRPPVRDGLVDVLPGDPDRGARRTFRVAASPAAGWSHAVRSLAGLPVRIAGAGARLLGGGAQAVRHPREMLERARALTELVVRDELIAAPRTSLNVAIGAKRRIAVTGVPLAELKAIKTRLGGTVNDVVLATAAGGLRRLLLSRGDSLPPQGLRAMVPVNIRAAGEELALGNRITSLFVHLPVDEEDPLARYRRQVEEAESLKAGSQTLGSSTLLDLTRHAPPIIHSFLARSLFASRLFNLTITNVPGPQVPLYAFGSRLTDVWPLVPLAAEHAVGLAVLSYDGRVFFALNADRDSVPDLGVLANGLEESLAELHDAALARTAAAR
jgi:diacylglycerol O-acyltransferase / wax synthase